jgi:hypothetical protein
MSSKLFRLVASVVVTLAACSCRAHAQHSPANTADALSALVVHRFETGTPDAFDSVYSDPDGRDLVRQANRAGWKRIGGLHRVVNADSTRAVLMLSGTVTSGSAGSDVVISRAFSGFYEALRRGDNWTIARKLPLDSANRISAQNLHVTVMPGSGLRVTDTMRIDVGASHGFAARLHSRARLSSVRLDGRPAEYAFAGGLLWVAARRGTHARLALQYTLDVAPDTVDGEPGRFSADFGHVRHYYFWHPFFDIASASDQAHFTVQVRVPADFYVTTSRRQSEKVVGKTRVITAASSRPMSGLALAYDRDWRPTTLRKAGLEVQAFMEPTQDPPPSSFVDAIRRAHELLTQRFGPPGGQTSGYYAIARLRSLPATQAFRTNELIAVGVQGMPPNATGSPQAGAPLAHEVSHAWTHPTGLGEGWLSEGWATYIESLVIREELGAAEETAYWERLRAMHYRTNSEGRTSVIGERAVRIASYRKGPWVFRALAHALGDDVFNAGMRNYVALLPGASSGLDTFIAIMSKAAGRDVRSLVMPWLTETSLPEVHGRIEEGRVIVTQVGAIFDLPKLDVVLMTPTDTTRRRIELRARVDTIDHVGDAVTAVRIDPDHHYLLRRDWGDTVRFVLPVSDVPTAQKMELWGDFAVGRRVPAVRIGDSWTVELPVAEGRYEWGWIADGKAIRTPDHASPSAGPLLVRAIRPLAAPYPM